MNEAQVLTARNPAANLTEEDRIKGGYASARQVAAEGRRASNGRFLPREKNKITFRQPPDNNGSVGGTVNA